MKYILIVFVAILMMNCAKKEVYPCDDIRGYYYVLNNSDDTIMTPLQDFLSDYTNILPHDTLRYINYTGSYPITSRSVIYPKDISIQFLKFAPNPSYIDSFGNYVSLPIDTTGLFLKEESIYIDHCETVDFTYP